MDIIEKARELGELLKQDERCIRLQAAKAANDLDTGLQNLIGEFNLKRLSLDNELSGEHIDRDKAKEYETDIRRLYGQIMAHPGMAEYTAAKKDVDELVGHINSIVQTSITGEPETASGGCTGSCEGCAGCH